jgi:large conductance mechanosensitive channel
MLREFKDFALRGNVLDLAVAVILGIAFGAVVNSFTSDILMALIGAIVGEPNFHRLSFGIGDGVVAYGRFLTTVANFLLIAFSLFLVVKGINRLAQRGEETPTTRPCPYCATQIPRSAKRCPACTSDVQPEVA